MGQVGFFFFFCLASPGQFSGKRSTKTELISLLHFLVSPAMKSSGMNAKLGVSILLVLLVGVPKVLLDGTNGHASAPDNTKCNGTPGADQESKTFDDDRNQSGPGTTQPPMLTVLKKGLESLGVTDASSCIADLGLLLSTPGARLKPVPGNFAKLCTASQLVLTRVQNLTDDCLAPKLADTETEIGSGISPTTSETITPDLDDFNATAILELASEKLTLCCERQTSTNSSNSQVARCLLQEDLHHDYKALRNFLLDFKAMLPSDLSCTQELSTVASQLLEAKLALAQASIRSTDMAGILESSTQLGK